MTCHLFECMQVLISQILCYIIRFNLPDYIMLIENVQNLGQDLTFKVRMNVLL